MAIRGVLCRAHLFINNDRFIISTYSPVIKCIPINKLCQQQTLKQLQTNIKHFSITTSFNKDKHEIKKQQNSEQHVEILTSNAITSSSSSDSEDTDDENNIISGGYLNVEYHKGLPKIIVPLPSRNEKCSFTLKPISQTVGDLLEMLKKEDKGIDRIVCKSLDGTRIASANTIETLLDDDFKLIINDKTYNVNTPKAERVTSEEVKSINDVKNLVSKLYATLHIDEHQISKEKELLLQLESLQQEIQPLEEKTNEIQLVAHRKSDWLAWAGLGLMSVQFGILARLTWWEYSWDIMEPVTYFVTYGTAMACYAYFVLTKEEYILGDVRNRQHLVIVHKKAKQLGLDLDRYNHLKDEINKVQYKLKKLRNPLKLHLPKRNNDSATTTTTTADDKTTTESVIKS